MFMMGCQSGDRDTNVLSSVCKVRAETKCILQKLFSASVTTETEQPELITVILIPVWSWSPVAEGSLSSVSVCPVTLSVCHALVQNNKWGSRYS